LRGIALGKKGKRTKLVRRVQRKGGKGNIVGKKGQEGKRGKRGDHFRGGVLKQRVVNSKEKGGRRGVAFYFFTSPRTKGRITLKKEGRESKVIHWTG